MKLACIVIGLALVAGNGRAAPRKSSKPTAGAFDDNYWNNGSSGRCLVQPEAILVHGAVAFMDVTWGSVTLGAVQFKLGKDGKVAAQTLKVGKPVVIKGKKPAADDLATDKTHVAKVTGVRVRGQFTIDADDPKSHDAELELDGLAGDNVIDTFGCHVSFHGRATPIKIATCSDDVGTCGQGGGYLDCCAKARR
jgi:hypothetical protein